jgi:hypothetical protein
MGKLPRSPQSDGNNILLLESLKESEQLEKAKHDSWIGCVKEIFKYLKLDYIYDDSSKYGINYILCKVKIFEDFVLTPKIKD